MNLSNSEKRELEKIGMRLRIGSTPTFRLQSFTERLRGRDAAMGYSSVGRIAEYAPLMSFVLDEPVYRNKEVSPQLDTVLAVCFTGEPSYDQRVLDYCLAWSYLIIHGLNANVVIVPFGLEKFNYDVPANNLIAAEESANRIKTAFVGTQLDVFDNPKQLKERSRYFSSCIGAYFDGFHLVMIGPYWERPIIQICRSNSPYGVTFCMVETKHTTGCGFFGDAFPRFAIKHRVKERRIDFQECCRRVRANSLVCTSEQTPVVSLCEQLKGAKVL